MLWCPRDSAQSAFPCEIRGFHGGAYILGVTSCSLVLLTTFIALNIEVITSGQRHGLTRPENCSIHPPQNLKPHSYLTFQVYTSTRSLDSSVCIVAGCGPENRGVGIRVPIGSRFFTSRLEELWGSTQPLIQWVPRDMFPGVNRQGREAATSAEIKTTWICASTPPYAFMA
jgi:hypothetical protein